ncbi:MAG TPA: carboxypeptidase regulatory-like domain-containing protein [Polyangia bacterium]
MSRIRVVLPLAIVALAACKKEAPREPAPAAPSAAAPAPTAAPAAKGATGGGSITGAVKLTGAPPEMALTKRQADPYCAKTPMKEEEVIVGPGGGLKNVIVRITAGVTGHYDPPATPASVDQQACMYRPRVQGIVLGQPLKVTNSDQTLHNIHGYKGASTLFNQAEVPGLPPMTKQLNDADQIVKLKCDVHPWMTAYVLVSSHPYFAVTGDDGTFKIPGVPPGSYTVEAWHERYGAKTAQITVAGDKPAEAAFQFEAK